MADLTARSHGYYRVYVDDQEISKHLQEREAAERALDEKEANPTAEVRYEHDYVVDVTLEAGEEPTPPDPPEDPVEEPTGGDTSTEDSTTADGTTDGGTDSGDTTTDSGSTDTGGTSVSPVATFDPDQFASSDELRSPARNVYGRTDLLHLDTAVPRPGGASSMRYDFINQQPDNAITVGRRVPLPSPVRELWVKAQLRWSKNFMNIQNPPTTPGWTYGHKLLFGKSLATETSPNFRTSDDHGVYRWSIVLPGGGSGAGSLPGSHVKIEAPSNVGGGQMIENKPFDCSSLFDEAWHVLKLHWRSDPGLYEAWIDGTQVAQQTGFTVHPEIDIYQLLLGRNKDDGIESGTESIWWGKVEAWDTDPGW